jgi:hypothetical protein
MSDWQTIDSAPKDRGILLYGTQAYPMPELNLKGPLVFSGYWDSIDEAWCASGSTWAGPFFDCTHWMEQPKPPVPA